MPTARSSPADGEKPEDFCWATASGSKIPSHGSPWTHTSRLAGRSLVHAKTPWDLFVAIGDGMLGAYWSPVMIEGVTTSYILTGWLLMLKMGFLHRDINIGNVLMLGPPVTKVFGAWTIEQFVTQLRLQGRGEPLAEHVSLLEQMIGELGSPGKCYGFVVDGNMATCLEDYFTPRSMEEKSVSAPIVSGTWLMRCPRREHTSSCPRTW